MGSEHHLLIARAATYFYLATLKARRTERLEFMTAILVSSASFSSVTFDAASIPLATFLSKSLCPGLKPCKFTLPNRAVRSIKSPLKICHIYQRNLQFSIRDCVECFTLGTTNLTWGIFISVCIVCENRTNVACSTEGIV